MRLRIGKLTLKITLILMLLIVLTFLMFSFMLVYFEKKKISEDIKSNGLIFAEFSSDSIYSDYLQLYKHSVSEDMFLKFNSRLNSIMQKNSDIVEISLISSSGKILFISGDKIVDTSNNSRYIYDKEVLAMLAGDSLTSRDIVYEGVPAVEIIVPLRELSGTHLVSTKYILKYNSLAERINALYLQLFFMLFPLLILALLMILLISMFLTNPLIKLIEIVRKFSSGTDSIGKSDIVIHSNDEIGELSNVFNEMLSNLKKSRVLLESYNKNLEEDVNKRTVALNLKVEELKNSEKRFYDIALSSGDFIWETDIYGKYTLVTGNVHDLLGYNSEEIIGKSILDFMPSAEANRVSEKLKNILEQHTSLIDFENWHITKSGKKLCLLTNATPIINNQGIFEGHRGVHKDITERKRAEEELMLWENGLIERDKKINDANLKLESVNHQLQELDKQKDEFISLAAHELKTPLTSIRGFAQLLQSNSLVLDHERSKHYLELINVNTDRLYALVTDLVDSSRLNLGKLKLNIEPVDVYKLFEDIKENASIMISDKGLVPRFTISEHLPKINADYERTLQVLRNLISNSTKFTSWGTVSLKIALDEKDNNYVCFELKDTGQGIPEENKSMIFSRFYQVDSSMARKIGGSGLGLSICKGLIDSMGGKIWFESEVGQGSTFYFTLPVLKENNVSK